MAKEEVKKEIKKIQKEEAQSMTAAESRAYRASLHKPEERELSEQEKREEFRKFWALEKAFYGKAKDNEPILWIHLKSIGKHDPKDFAEGLKHFGLKKVK